MRQRVATTSRVNVTRMMRALAMFAGCLIVCVVGVGGAHADTVARDVEQLADASASYKVHLGAALALSKSKDARAIIALADALGKDPSVTIRRVAAISLEKQVDAHTPEDAKALAFEALDRATSDSDAGVRQSAAGALKALAGLRRSKASRPVPRGDRPEVLVKIDSATDQSRKAPGDAADRLTKVVKASIEKTGYATSWPGGLPTSSDLASARSRAFIVASTVKKIDISRVGHQMQIACTVQIRVAPWSGSDGGEKWEASKAAQAQGSAKATTGPSDRDIRGGVRDCLEAVAEDITSRQIVPFLKRLAVASAP
jgi:hypothetical protein